MDDHSRTIIHIDIDCFYAQVEMVKNPSLVHQPLGIKQKNIVVTSNYLAREYGVTKCMLISEAKKTIFIQSNTTLTKLHRLEKQNSINNGNLVGYFYGNTDLLCECGCTERLKVGTQIAQEIRDLIYKELKLTTCAGIAQNKLLAKIVCTKNKPNKQTVVFPNSVNELMLDLNLVKNIPYIGNATVEQLSNFNVKTVEELQNCDVNELAKVFGIEKAKNMLDFSFGRDTAPVKKTGKPQSIGLEDSCRAITAEREIESKLQQLLLRLMVLVKEDGRIPKTIKLTVRKFNNSNPQSATRETRQCNVNTALFKDLELTEANQAKLMKIIMTLFRKVVDIKRSFHITLLGLSFTKFVEKLSVRNTLVSFLTKDIEVQSFIDIANQNSRSPVREASTSSYAYYDNVDSPESLAKRGRFFVADRIAEFSDSPIKLGVATLRLNSTESPMDLGEKTVPCPPDNDEEVFRALPNDLQTEVWEDYRRKRERTIGNSKSFKRSKPNSILNYLNKEK
ncbi:hypothetical protein GWI33_021207 [Rhynchophorus ferrugineus]|uniref:UmuC domain-containing protein n=1 Tax=Rhynchophorus ferrugineus TaxID=354439 RepID=A0A834HP45_RHYFE|nr:hypothetical protein GWI33_021207 [Rhynchophorus ferrugineus]